MSNINEIPQGSWWYSYINLNTKNFDFFHENSKSVTLTQRSPPGWDGADKNFRPISTIMPYMNEIHRRVFKILGLINFNTKTLTLWLFYENSKSVALTPRSPLGWGWCWWQKDEQMNKRMYVRTDEWKSEHYIPPHTSYVGGYKNINVYALFEDS